MPSTPQSQARRWLRAVAREGAHYVEDLPLYDDEPYALMSAAACHYGYEHDDSLYREECIASDPAHRTATLALASECDDLPWDAADRHARRLTGCPRPADYGPERHRPGARHTHHHMRGHAMIHRISAGDIPMVGATVLSLGDGDAWAPVAPADPHDLAAIDVPTYEERGIGDAADLPWADADALGPHSHSDAPTAADWQAVLTAAAGAATMVACLPACWVGETMSTTSGWVAVARQTLQSEAEHVLAMAGEPAACICATCRDAGMAGAAVAWSPAGAICEWCGAPADMACRIL